MSEAALLKAERDLARQSTRHHMARERELEHLLAGFIALAKDKPRCKCVTAVALRQLADELETPARAR